MVAGGRLALTVVSLLLVVADVWSLENGLSKVPPMGWMSWERFMCNVDCNSNPENCISERLFREMTDHLMMDGFRDAGYSFVIIDDCWMAPERDVSGRLQPDPTRFPAGIKSLADYVHARGLKLGIYGDVGTKTCAGYPGSLGHSYTDMQTFADWEVDYVKMDGCFADVRDMPRLYAEVTDAINRTGRHMVYSCSWPAYEVFYGINPDYNKIAKYCNLWRNYMDISDSWQSVVYTIDFYASVQNKLAAASGPGKWNDPDMLVIGNFGLSVDQSKTQMAMWAILAAPLLMSNDLRRLRPEHKRILLNRGIIAVNQDPYGIMGKRVTSILGIEIWTRPIGPVDAETNDFSYALLFFNRKNMGEPEEISTPLSTIGLTHAYGYHIVDLYENKPLGTYRPHDILYVEVNPTGCAMMKATVVGTPKVPAAPAVGAVAAPSKSIAATPETYGQKNVQSVAHTRPKGRRPEEKFNWYLLLAENKLQRMARFS